MLCLTGCIEDWWLEQPHQHQSPQAEHEGSLTLTLAQHSWTVASQHSDLAQTEGEEEREGVREREVGRKS